MQRSSTTPPITSLARRLWASADRIGFLETRVLRGAETREEKAETFRRAWWSEYERRLEFTPSAHDNEAHDVSQIKQGEDEHQIDPAIHQNILTDIDGEQLSAQGYVPHTELYGGLWSNVRYPDPLLHLRMTSNDSRSTKA